MIFRNDARKLNFFAHLALRLLDSNQDKGDRSAGSASFQLILSCFLYLLEKLRITLLLY